jgi:polar amino acid transport system ATP-binding protein
MMGAHEKQENMASVPMVEFKAVCKSFGDFEVLRSIDFRVEQGEVACIIGASGSGKSTMLRCVNHLEHIDSGELKVDGEYVGYYEKGDILHELPERKVAMNRRDIGMVFQDFGLFPNMNVLENVMSGPLLVQKQSHGKAKQIAVDLLDRVGLADKTKSSPAALSGGQKQRVAIARALAMNPKLMLFDEPTSALDPELVGDVLAVIKDLAQGGMTMLIVTHEINFAREVADVVAFVHEGRVLELGSPESMLDNPQYDRTRQFLARVV